MIAEPESRTCFSALPETGKGLATQQSKQMYAMFVCWLKCQKESAADDLVDDEGSR